MENNLETSVEKIPTVAFFIDLIFFVVAFFYSSKAFIITFLAINVLFLGAYIIIKKNLLMFEAMLGTQKMARGLNKMLGGL